MTEQEIVTEVHRLLGDVSPAVVLACGISILITMYKCLKESDISQEKLDEIKLHILDTLIARMKSDGTEIN